MFRSLQTFTLKSNAQCDGIRKWTFGRWLGHEGRALMSGISVLKTPESSTMRTQPKNGIHEPGSGSHQIPNVPVP